MRRGCPPATATTYRSSPSARLALNRRSICRPAKSAASSRTPDGRNQFPPSAVGKSTRYSSELSCQRSAIASVVPSGDQSLPASRLATGNSTGGASGPAHSINGVICGNLPAPRKPAQSNPATMRPVPARLVRLSRSPTGGPPCSECTCNFGRSAAWTR